MIVSSLTKEIMMAAVIVLNYFVSKVLSHAYATFLSLALGPEPSMAPLRKSAELLGQSLRGSIWVFGAS